MPRFAANLGYLFTDRPMLERVGAAAAAGFRAVELQFPYEIPAPVMKVELEKHGLKVLGVNTPPGDPQLFGLAAIPGREKEWLPLFQQALDYISAIGGTAVHVLSGKVPQEKRAEAHRTFVANLRIAADLAAAKDITVLIEPINSIDRPDYFLDNLDQAVEAVNEAGKPNIKIQYDFYHMQIVGGDLLRRLEKHFGIIGHIQIGSVPERHEPDEGEINYPAVFERIDRLGYAGWLGCEYRPRGKTEDGLGWARKIGFGA